MNFAPTLECIEPILQFVLPMTCTYRYAFLLPSVEMNQLGLLNKMTTWFQLHSCLAWENRSDLLMYAKLVACVGSTLQQIREALKRSGLISLRLFRHFTHSPEGADNIPALPSGMAALQRCSCNYLQSPWIIQTFIFRRRAGGKSKYTKKKRKKNSSGSWVHFQN